MLNARRKPLVQHRPMKKGKGNPIPTKVRAAVRGRSKDWCEVGIGHPCAPDSPWPELPARAQDMHHLVKRPRLHEPWAIVHLCRRHHEMCEGPYAKGRLVFVECVWAPDGPPRPPDAFRWAIEVRARKGSPLLATLAQGTINLAPLRDGAGDGETP